MSPRQVKGFTVFELMVTVAIVAVIAAFAIPGFQDVRVRGRLNAAAQEFSASLQLARNTAIVRRRTVILVPSATTSSWGNAWDQWMDSTTGVRLSSHRVPSPVTLLIWQGATQTDTVQQITFGTSGQVQRTAPGAPTPLNMTVRICDSSVNNEVGRDVVINAIGRITVTQHSDKSVCNP